MRTHEGDRVARPVVIETGRGGLTPTRRGKVRDVYDLGDGRLVLVATDRISAYDVVLPNGIPDKGRLLTQLSAFWFRLLEPVVPHHMISTDLTEMPEAFRARPDLFAGRSMLVRKTVPYSVECVVRGVLTGSAWKEYRESGTVAGEPMPRGLADGDRLDAPLFTPATKEESGHDVNISFARMEEIVGRDAARLLRARSLAVYAAAAEHAARCGLLLADTKLELGVCGGETLLIDEVGTPDSSRYWDAGSERRVSFDKQFVRDWLDASGWDHTPPAPPLSDEVVEKTRALYQSAYRRITGRRDLAA
jgi:phosphoribosylaminoimidazole-succinocarboxamide synthase